jgi:hypothetical protein
MAQRKRSALPSFLGFFDFRVSTNLEGDLCANDDAELNSSNKRSREILALSADDPAHGVGLKHGWRHHGGGKVFSVLQSLVWSKWTGLEFSISDGDLDLVNEGE